MKKLKIRNDIKDINNISEELARGILELRKMNIRVAQRDDKRFMLTCDFRTDRINLNIQKGVIVENWIG